MTNKDDIIKVLTYIYTRLEDINDEVEAIPETHICDVEMLVKGKMIGGHYQQGLVDMINEVLDDIENLKDDCKDLPEENN